LRNRADHVIMPVNQSSSFRRFRSANYFPHSAFPQITHTLFCTYKVGSLVISCIHRLQYLKSEPCITRLEGGGQVAVQR